jgi:hypothetical protein
VRTISFPTVLAEDGFYDYDVDDLLDTAAATVGTVGWPAGAENVEGTTQDHSIISNWLMYQSDNRRSFPT